MINEERNKVFEEIDNIKEHPTYKETIVHLWRLFAYTVTTIVLIIALLFGLYSYDYHKTGEQCVQRCKAEHLSDNCNGYCY